MIIKLQVTMLNMHPTIVSLTHCQELLPFGRRQITLELTTEQVELLKPRLMGKNNGNPVFEDVGHVWLEYEHSIPNVIKKEGASNE